MEEVFCFLILIALTIITIFILYVVQLKALGFEGIDLHCFVGSYAFPSVIKNETDNNGTTTWLFNDVKLDDAKILKKVFICTFYSFIPLLFNVLLVFYRFLLLGGSYNCSKNDTETKNCSKLWRNKLENNSIECNNTSIQNGTDLEIEKCYKVVFNPVLALAVSYGTFKFSTFVLSVASSGLLMIKQGKTVECITKTTAILLFLAILPMPIFLTKTFIKLNNSPANIYVLHISFSMMIFAMFLLFPWGKLIALKKAQTEAVHSQESELENSTVNFHGTSDENIMAMDSQVTGAIETNGCRMDSGIENPAIGGERISERRPNH